jgi:DNA polymerase-3 subunit delta'
MRDDSNPRCINCYKSEVDPLYVPPPRGVVFLVSSAPGRLLPTIRSRCRRLTFAPWDEGRLTDYAMARTDLDFDDAQRLAQMAKGAPGRVMDMAAGNALAMDQLAKDLLQRLPAIDDVEILGLTEGFRGAEGATRFGLLMDRLADQIHGMAMDSALAGQMTPGLDQWAQAWDSLTALPPQVEGLNLDRTDALWTVLTQLRAAARV